jgi:hypothetical protein
LKTVQQLLLHWMERPMSGLQQAQTVKQGQGQGP